MGPDYLTPVVFNDAGDDPPTRLTMISSDVWESEIVPSDLCRSLIIAFSKKGDKSFCDNHRVVTLTNIVHKNLCSIVPR